MKMSGEIMVTGKWLCWVTVVMMLCAVWAVDSDATCGAQCSCTVLAILCRGCPRIFPPAALTDRTEHILIDGCHTPFENFSSDTRIPKSILKLSVVNSELTNLTSLERFIRSAESLILQNNSIETITFKTLLPNITFVDLSLNRLNSVQNESFSNLPNLRYLDLSKNRIIKMTTKCFIGLTKLQHLDLSLNNMTSLSNVFSPLISLQHLNLSWNHIELLPEGCFSSLVMLQHLDVSYNRLTSVAPGALQFLPNLARLLLADNPKLGINQLDGQLLVGTGRRLQQVDASRTGLIQVPEALTHSVRFLNLAGNKIATIRCGDLDSYPLLQTLDFTDNVMSSIEDDALGRLELLSKLHLNNNNLRTVPKMLPSELTELLMNNNMISNLTITDFINLPNLKILLLAKNDIYFIQENVFIQLFSLQVLDLSYNPIKSLTSSTLNGPSDLRELNLSYLDISLPITDLFFPVSSPEGLEKLELQNSPGLTHQFLNDTAVLAALTRLQYLDLSYTNLTSLRSDLIYYMSQLRTLKLEGNKIDCNNLNWLANWVRDNPNNDNLLKCFYPSTFLHEQYVVTTILSTAQEFLAFPGVGKNITNPKTAVVVRTDNDRKRKYESKNYSKSNILRDVTERRDMQNNNIAHRYIQVQLQKPIMKTERDNDTDSRKLVTEHEKNNIRKLVNFFRTSNKTVESLRDTHSVGNKTVTSKYNVGIKIAELATTNHTQSKLTPERVVIGDREIGREPQSSSLRLPSSPQNNPALTVVLSNITNYSCGDSGNKSDTIDKTKCLAGFGNKERIPENNNITVFNKSNTGGKLIKSKFIHIPYLPFTPKREYERMSKKIKNNIENKEKLEKKTHRVVNTEKNSTISAISETIENMTKVNITGSVKELLNDSRLTTKSINDSRGEWSRYSDERTRSHPGALVALAGIGLCVAIWAAIHVWGRQRARKNNGRPFAEHEDIEVPSVHAPGGLW